MDVLLHRLEALGRLAVQADGVEVRSQTPPQPLQ
jgi:hypothetical protein